MLWWLCLATSVFFLLDKPHRLLLHRGDHLFGPHVSQMTVHDEKCMDDAGDPKTESQNQIQNRLYGLPTKQDGDRREDDGEQISHG